MKKPKRIRRRTVESREPKERKPFGAGFKSPLRRYTRRQEPSIR